MSQTLSHSGHLVICILLRFKGKKGKNIMSYKYVEEKKPSLYLLLNINCFRLAPNVFQNCLDFIYKLTNEFSWFNTSKLMDMSFKTLDLVIFTDYCYFS